MLQVCTASPSSRDTDDNKYETLLSNPPVEQNLIHGSFCKGDDCYSTKNRADEKDATSSTEPAAASTTYTAVDGCKRLVEKLINTFETSSLMEDLRSLDKFTSDNNGITKKAAATLSKTEATKPTGSENSLPIIDVSCLRKAGKSEDGENGDGVVRLPVVRRIFRFYVHNNPPGESTATPIAKGQEENLVLNPLIHTEEPKYHSTVVNEQRVILPKIPITESNIHVLPLLTPVNPYAHYVSDGRSADNTQGVYHLLHPLHSTINTQSLNYIAPSAMEHYTSAYLQNYAPETPKLPEIMHLANTQPVSPIALYRVVVKEPTYNSVFHAYENSQVPSAYLHTIYPNEAAKLPTSQWWYPSPSTTSSKQVHFVQPNHGQSLPSDYLKKVTAL